MSPIPPEEELTRYIFWRDHFNRNNNRVKYAAFTPLNGETSVFRISGLEESGVWGIGNNVAQRSSRTLRARADFFANDVFDIGLHIRPDIDPSSRHANITNWPEGNAKWRLVAQKLADRAQLHLIIGAF